MSFKQEQQLVHCEQQQDRRESGRSLIPKQEVSHDDGSSERAWEPSLFLTDPRILTIRMGAAPRSSPSNDRWALPHPLRIQPT